MKYILEDRWTIFVEMRQSIFNVLAMIAVGILCWNINELEKKVETLNSHSKELVNALDVVTTTMMKQALWSKEISEKVYGQTNQIFSPVK